MRDLALKVGELDDVVVGDPKRPDPGSREIEQRRRAESARAQHEHPGGSQAPLTGHPHLGQQQMPGVARAGGGVGELVWALPGSGVHRGRDYVMAVGIPVSTMAGGGLPSRAPAAVPVAAWP